MFGVRRVKYHVWPDRHPPIEVNYEGWKESVVLLGDSTTYGQAIDDKYKLHNILDTNRNVINLAYPSFSNEHILRLLVDHIVEFGYPHMVIIGYSSPWRQSFISKEENSYGSIISLGNWNVPSLYPEELLDRDTLKEKTIDIVKACRLICVNCCKYFEWTVFAAAEKDRQSWIEDMYIHPFEDRGDDNMHPGPLTIQKLGEKIGTI